MKDIPKLRDIVSFFSFFLFNSFNSNSFLSWDEIGYEILSVFVESIRNYSESLPSWIEFVVVVDYKFLLKILFYSKLSSDGVWFLSINYNQIYF